MVAYNNGSSGVMHSDFYFLIWNPGISARLAMGFFKSRVFTINFFAINTFAAYPFVH